MTSTTPCRHLGSGAPALLGMIAAMASEPSPATLASLRVTREAHRLATAVLATRCDRLDTIPCAWCGRTIAVATDASKRVRDFDGRVVCGPCLKSRRAFEREPQYLPEPPLSALADEIEDWSREGWVVLLPDAPDPRPTVAEWLRSLLRRGELKVRGNSR